MQNKEQLQAAGHHGLLHPHREEGEKQSRIRLTATIRTGMNQTTGIQTRHIHDHEWAHSKDAAHKEAVEKGQ